MGVLQAVLDNPILVKHARSRLRPAQALPWAVIVLVMVACIVWAGEYYRWIGYPAAVMLMVGLQIMLLVFGGSNQLNNSLGGVRETGLLDFHRVSPLPPSLVALGFFLGAPIREYALAALTVPFALYCAYNVDGFDPGKGLLWFLQLEVAVLLTGWIVHALSMLSCMTRKKPRGSMGGTIAAIFLMIFISYLGSFGFYFGSRWLLDERRVMNFFGFMIPWLAWILIYELPLLGFLGLAVSRKMEAERAHSFTKPQALACMATFTLLVSGGLWDIGKHLPMGPPIEPTPVDAIMLASVYVLSLVAMILAVTITPDSGTYVKGLRRAARQGRRRLSSWSDAGSNRLALFALCALVMIGATTVVHVIGRPPLYGDGYGPSVHEPRSLEAVAAAEAADEEWLASRKAFLSRPIAVGILTLAYFGLGLQYFMLRTRTSGMVLMTLFLFIAWLVPLLAGAVLGIAGTNDTRGMAIFALSPLPGLALSSGLGKLAGADTIQLAALAPPITFAFIFNYLLVVTQRKIDRRLHAGEKTRAHPGTDPVKTMPTAQDRI